MGENKYGGLFFFFFNCFSFAMLKNGIAPLLDLYIQIENKNKFFLNK